MGNGFRPTGCIPPCFHRRHDDYFQLHIREQHKRTTRFNPNIFALVNGFLYTMSPFHSARTMRAPEGPGLCVARRQSAEDKRANKRKSGCLKATVTAGTKRRARTQRPRTSPLAPMATSSRTKELLRFSLPQIQTKSWADKWQSLLTCPLNLVRRGGGICILTKACFIKKRSR